METRQLGNSDLHITPIGMGTWAIGGGGWSYAWGPQDDRDSIAAINCALDMGINWIDTAPVYGLGHSEEVVAEALRGRAEKPYIFTKCTRRWDDQGILYGSLKAHDIREEVEQSLRRLKIDVIDLMQVHWPDPDSDIEEGWTALARLQAEGKIRYIGVSNFNVAQMERAQAIAPITSLQPPYSLLNREIEQDVLGYCQQHTIGVIVYGTMVNGLLAGAMTHDRVMNFPQDDWRRNHQEFQEPHLSRNLKLVELLRELGAPYNRTPGEVAIAWTLHHPAVTAAIVGARRAEQVDGVIGAGTFRLSADEINRIETFLSENP